MWNSVLSDSIVAETAVARGGRQGEAIDTDVTVDPVDEVLPPGKLILLGLQHVLVMYAGVVAVPLILGSAMKLPKDQVALLINAGRKVSQDDLARGLRTDGLGTLIGGLFNTFPYTSFSQNVGLVGVTGVRSRWVTAVGGVILIAFGIFPKMGYVVASVPQFVLGGAGIVMFGMVAATGIRILAGL
jgi:xanthine/uracil permease